MSYGEIKKQIIENFNIFSEKGTDGSKIYYG